MTIITVVLGIILALPFIMIATYFELQKPKYDKFFAVFYKDEKEEHRESNLGKVSKRRHPLLPSGGDRSKTRNRR